MWSHALICFALFELLLSPSFGEVTLDEYRLVAGGKCPTGYGLIYNTKDCTDAFNFLGYGIPTVSASDLGDTRPPGCFQAMADAPTYHVNTNQNAGTELFHDSIEKLLTSRDAVMCVLSKSRTGEFHRLIGEDLTGEGATGATRIMNTGTLDATGARAYPVFSGSGRVDLTQEVVPSTGNREFVLEWTNVNGGASSNQWLGFRSTSFTNQDFIFDAWVQFVGSVPPSSGNYGLKVCGTFYNNFIDRCKPDEWCQISEEVHCNGGDSNHIILIFDTVTTKGQKVKFSGVFLTSALGGENLALGRPTQQSSVTHTAPSSRAVDGNRDANWIGGSCIHTSHENNPWWRVDLGEIVDVGQVVIYNREDCCSDRLNQFILTVSKVVGGPAVRCGRSAGNIQHLESIHSNCFVRGQHLELKIERRATLNFCEVEVYASSVGAWDAMDGGLDQVEVGDGKIVGVNSIDKVYGRSLTGSTWIEIGGALKQIDIGDGQIVGSNSVDNVYYRRGISTNNPFGTAWVQLDGSLTYVAIGNGKMMGTKDGVVYVRDGITETNPVGTAWRAIDGNLKLISIGDDKVMGVDSQNRVFYRFGVNRQDPYGTEWRQLGGGHLKQVDVGDGKIMGVDASDNVWYRWGIDRSNPFGRGWQQGVGYLKHVSVGDNTFVGVNEQDHILRRDAEIPFDRNIAHSGERVTFGPYNIERVDDFDTVAVLGNHVQVELAKSCLLDVETHTDMRFRAQRDDSNHASTFTYYRLDTNRQETFSFDGGITDRTVIDYDGTHLNCSGNPNNHECKGLPFGIPVRAILLSIDMKPRQGSLVFDRNWSRNQYSLSGSFYTVVCRAARSFDLQIRGVDGSEVVDILTPTVRERVLLSNSLQTHSYLEPSDRNFSLHFLNDIHTDNIRRDVFVEDHRKMEIVRAGDEFGVCGGRNEHSNCKLIREGGLFFGGVYHIIPFQAKAPTCINRCSVTPHEVCGSDGKTYLNRCLFEYSNCKTFYSMYVVSDGPCLGLERCLPEKRLPERFCELHMKVKSKYRTFDGACNNVVNLLHGAAGAPFSRVIQDTSDGLRQGAQYYDFDKLSQPAGYPSRNPKIPSPHEVSQEFFTLARTNSGNDAKFSILHTTFGQFLDHDMTHVQYHRNGGGCSLTPSCQPGSTDDFQPPCLPMLTPPGNAQTCTEFARTQPMCQTPLNQRPRMQVNTLSSFIDASQVYGPYARKARELRTLDGTGRMKIQSSGLLPLDPHHPLPCNARGGCWLAGDERADENNALASIHTLFVREHNRIADELGFINPSWNGEKIYDETRKIVGGVFQHIVYNEYIPTLTDLSRFTGYKPHVDASASSAFATAAYRFGHGEVPNFWPSLDANFDQAYPPLLLRAMYFNNTFLFDRGIEPMTFGLLGNETESANNVIAESLSRFLFIPIGRSGLADLMSFNLQRGREHGIPGYWHWRKHCGLGTSRNFDSLLQDLDKPNIEKLKKLYNNRMEHVDLWAGGIAEKHVRGKALGRTFGCILKDQFERLRDGDRFYYENEGVFSEAQLRSIKEMSFARVFCNNLKGMVSVQEDVFYAGRSNRVSRVSCDRIPQLDLSPWRQATSTV